MLLAHHTLFHQADTIRWTVECIAFFTIPMLLAIIWSRRKEMTFLTWIGSGSIFLIMSNMIGIWTRFGDKMNLITPLTAIGIALEAIGLWFIIHHDSPLDHTGEEERNAKNCRDHECH